MRASRVPAVAVALLMARATVAQASPPPERAPVEDAPADQAADEAAMAEEVGPEESPPEGDSGGAEDETLTQVRKLFALGAAKFDLGDCGGAIEAWEQAYELSPLSWRGQLQVPLASAHVCGYEADSKPEHLRRAEVLYRDYLAALDAGDVETRIQTEALLAEVQAELERLETEAKAREAELAEREAVAREEAAKEFVERQMRDTWTEEERRRHRTYNIIGGSLVGLGAASMGVMISGLALGEKVDTKGLQLTAADDYSEYETLRAEGKSWNAVAGTTGAIGGALVVSGAALIIVAAVQRKMARGRLGPEARLVPGGLELRF